MNLKTVKITKKNKDNNSNLQIEINVFEIRFVHYYLPFTPFVPSEQRSRLFS